ncbi:PREDICTED: probable malonyl-CoA-acyl carrier protein transacylase, mitochondrial [Polistes canadensis]|uniref:probable malonyl-CoA-acyl carrier protein transacylase, mitochondrial n=1 Tax=Polistes canadensis TaxID=91411 RepID=UPI000718EB8E|nr:PREDICTED: probable malonyl-CoA-acyl carrier protein transacylase, mitochondrial [Polistes canadensis]
MSTMIKQVISNRIFLQLSSLCRFNRIDKFSHNIPNDQDNILNKRTTIDEKTSDDELNNTSNEQELKRLLKEAATYNDVKDTNWTTTPYPANAPTSVEEDKIEVPKINPQERTIILFPGQGTLKVGAVAKYLHYPAAKELFEIANEILGYNLLKICLKGPQEKLDQTRFNQPATVVSSLAALEKIREDRPKVFETCASVAGYSVGELSALIFSGAISVEDGIRLVAVRGQMMQVASDKVRQGMLSVYCSPEAKLSKILQDAVSWAVDLGVPNPVCKVSVYLYTQSKIIAGNEEALQYIEKNGTAMGLKRMKRLPVSGAFHTPLMQPALQKFFEALDTVTIEEPRTEVYSNYTGLPYRHLRSIKGLLLKQIVSPVKWEQCIQRIYKRPEGELFPRTFDVCSSGRMRTILKLINSKAAISCIVI